MHIASATIELHLPDVHSLKEKRATLKPIIEGARRRYSVAAAEVGHQDIWQRSIVGVATVSGSAAHARQVIDAVERFVWSFPEVEVTSTVRNWMTDEDD
jgi:uncharacterized protein YlxP (DUF503 family)